MPGTEKIYIAVITFYDPFFKKININKRENKIHDIKNNKNIFI